MNADFFRHNIIDNPDMFVKDGNGYRRPTMDDSDCTVYVKASEGLYHVAFPGTGDARTPPSIDDRRNEPPPGGPPPSGVSPPSETRPANRPYVPFEALRDAVKDADLPEVEIAVEVVKDAWWMGWRGCGCGCLVMVIGLIAMAILAVVAPHFALWLTQ